MTYPSLTAVVTERVIDPNAIEVPLVLICCGQDTMTAAGAIETAIRARYPDPQALIVAFVGDLHTVPRMLRGVAEGVLRSEYEKAVEGLAEGQMPYDYAIVLPDWDGKAIASFGLDDVGERAGVAVFAPPGGLVGVAQGDDAAAEALRLLDGLHKVA